MSKDKKKDSKKAKSQGEVVTEAMANVTSNAEAAKAAIKAGKKLAKERIELEDPILALSAPRPVEIVEPQEQRSVLTAYDKPSKKERKAEKANDGRIDYESVAPHLADDEYLPSQQTQDLLRAGNATITVTNGHEGATVQYGSPTMSNGGAVELTPESMATSAAPRTRTDNLLLLLKQAQESADLDNLPQLVECPRKYTTKNYGVQLVKKYAAEGINAEATEDTFIEPDRDHPKGMWQVTLRIKPKNPVSQAARVRSEYSEIVRRSVGANLDAADISTSDLPKPVVNPEKVKAPKSDKKKGKKGKK